MLLLIFQKAEAQTQMLWSKPQQVYDANNFNQNQYECALWVEGFDFYYMYDRGLSGAIVKDFNNDGYDDIVSASMGVIQRLPGQDPYTRWEKIPLLFKILATLRLSGLK